MDNLKIGVVGTNFVSDWFCNAVSRTDGVTVGAVYSRSAITGNKLAAKHGVPLVYVDYEAMLESDIDAVYIASPNFMHASQAIAAMEAGKHVLCEKIMAASYPQALRMRAASTKMGVVLLEAMRPDFDPATEVIKSNLHRVGRVRRAHLEYCQYSSRYDKFKKGEVENAFDPAICNSALADIGVYPLHQAIFLFGKPKSFSASSVILDNGFEGMGQITLGYSDMICEVSYSKITHGVSRSVIEGEDGSIMFDRVNAPTEIIFRARNGVEQRLEFAYEPENMVFEVAAFRDMVRGEMSAEKYLSVTMETVRIVNEAYRMTGAIRYMDQSLMK